MHLLHIAERYGLILEAFLRGCGESRRDLMLQNDSQQQLISAALAIKTVKNEKERLQVLLRELRKATFPPKFKLALDPRWQAKGLIVEKCKFMDSKKVCLPVVDVFGFNSLV